VGATTDELAWPGIIRLTASSGRVVDLGELAEQSHIVLYFYPGTSVSPEDGHRSAALDIAEHRAFDLSRDDFLALNSRVLGVSSESHEQQRAVAADLQHLLLSDPPACLAVELHLRTFTVDEKRWYCRNVVVLARGKAHLLADTRSPDVAPARTIAWMRAQGF
jgi:peroxiredoxin